MSANTATHSITRTLPARPPDGFWRAQRNYLAYVLFAATGFALASACVELLFGLAALRGGAASWARFMGVLRFPLVVLLNLGLLVGIFYFAVRFLWVGIKVAAAPIGPVPAPPKGLIMVLHFAGLATVTLAVLVLFSGFIGI